jgi:hypothetical protein
MCDYGRKIHMRFVLRESSGGIDMFLPPFIGNEGSERMGIYSASRHVIVERMVISYLP